MKYKRFLCITALASSLVISNVLMASAMEFPSFDDMALGSESISMPSSADMPSVDTSSLMDNMGSFNIGESSGIVGLQQMDMPELPKMELPEMSMPKLDISSTDNVGFSSLSTSDMSELLKQFSHNAISDSGMNFSDTFNSMSSDFKIDTGKLYNTVNAEADYGFVNLQFDNAMKNMSDFQGEYHTSIKDTSAASLFNDTYGDVVHNVDTSKYSIPKGYSPADMMATVNNQYKSTYGNDSRIQSMASSINISGVFADASKTMSMPTLSGMSSLSGMTSGFRAQAQQHAMSGLGQGVASISNAFDMATMHDSLSYKQQEAQQRQYDSQRTYEKVRYGGGLTSEE